MKLLPVEDKIYDSLMAMKAADRRNALKLAIGDYDLFRKMSTLVRSELRRSQNMQSSERVWKVRRVDNIDEPNAPSALVDDYLV